MLNITLYINMNYIYILGTSLLSINLLKYDRDTTKKQREP